MPTYEWSCRQGHDWDVVTTIAQRDEPSHCPHCQEVGTRGITMAQVSPTAGDWNRVEYNPGLGQWTKSWKHGREIAKAKGLEEVGNEKPGTILQRDDRRRAEKRAARWADDREMVYDSSK